MHILIHAAYYVARYQKRVFVANDIHNHAEVVSHLVNAHLYDFRFVSFSQGVKNRHSEHAVRLNSFCIHTQIYVYLTELPNIITGS